MEPDVLKQQLSITYWSKWLYYLLHTISYTSPPNPSDKDKRDYIEFYENLSLLVPSDMARTNYVYVLHTFPIEKIYDTKDNLIDWVIDLQNWVNRTFSDTRIDRKQTNALYKHNKLLINHNNYIRLFDFFVFYNFSIELEIYKRFFRSFVKVFPIHRLRDDIQILIDQMENAVTHDEFQLWYRDVFKKKYTVIYNEFIRKNVPEGVPLIRSISAKAVCECTD